jgi:hypothetical protein
MSGLIASALTTRVSAMAIGRNGLAERSSTLISSAPRGRMIGAFSRPAKYPPPMSTTTAAACASHFMAGRRTKGTTFRAATFCSATSARGAMPAAARNFARTRAGTSTSGSTSMSRHVS